MALVMNGDILEVRSILKTEGEAEERVGGVVTSLAMSLILDMIADSVSGHHESRSSENMRAGFEACNRNTSDDDKKNAIVLSMDVKSLYPSITKAVAKKAIEELLLNTDLNILNILNINWWEAVKF